MKTWDILKATYLIVLLHISNENTAYLFEISSYVKYFETRTKNPKCGINGVRLISCIVALKRGRAPLIFYVF